MNKTLVAIAFLLLQAGCVVGIIMTGDIGWIISQMVLFSAGTISKQLFEMQDKIK